MVKFITLILVAALAVPPFFFHKEITTFEIRYYIVVFLLICATMVFGVLRLYNAVYINNRFLFQLKVQLMNWKNALLKLEATISSEFKKLLQSFKKTNETLEQFNREVKKVQPGNSNQRTDQDDVPVSGKP